MKPRRRKESALERWLAHGTTPLFVIDAERRLAAFNAGCETLTGFAAAEVLGETCHYGGVAEGAGAASLAASLCPPPEAFAGNELSAPAYVVHRDGQAFPRLLHFFPLRGDEGELQGVLGIIMPLRQPEPGGEIAPERQLHAELASLRMALRNQFGPSTLVASGVPMRKVLAQVALAQQTNSGVLLAGEPGTGKEHLARVIHYGGIRKSQWFVPIDCIRLGPDEIDRVWSRLVANLAAGHTHGTTPQPGTVYLAEVERMPRDLQEQVVRLFDQAEREPPPLRLLASTTGDIDRAVAEQVLRPDFAALISPLTICVPPLRERSGDLRLLAQHFLEEQNRHDEKQLSGFDEAIWPLFVRYDWPGNLDELLVVVREARAQAADSLIRPRDLPFRFRDALDARESPPPGPAPSWPLDDLLAKTEKRLIELALERSRNNRSKAAELLGVHRARLIRRIEQLAIGQEKPALKGEASPAIEELSAELLKDEPPSG